MAKLLSDPEFQRFSELQQKQSSFTITSGEADELRDIVARAQQKRDDRAAAGLGVWTLVAAPVVDENDRLLGAVSVDDLLDHLLPEDWRDTVRDEATRPVEAAGAKEANGSAGSKGSRSKGSLASPDQYPISRSTASGERLRA